MMSAVIIIGSVLLYFHMIQALLTMTISCKNGKQTTNKQSMVDLGVQQCFGVVYHELTTLRRVYFARAALAVRAK